MLSRECCYVPKPMISCDEYSEKNRNVLANWIYEACLNFKFKIETYFLAVNIMDRVLGSRAVLTH